MFQSFNKRFYFLLIFAIFLLITISTIFLIIIYYKTNTIIETKSGKIIGVTVNRLGKKVNCYFGVPYAEPPIGELRFSKPIRKKPWTAVLKATKQANYCWQSKHSIDRNSSYVKHILKYIPDWDNFWDNNMSEDCLYLNIFVPNNEKRRSNLTVMVWIHGGSFQSGSISSPLFDGSILSAISDVIVVSINYRLGIFGFLFAENTELIGNYGLYDQVIALHWVKNNIEAFGGNPNNIVLFGESAGAISIGYHLITPLSKDLFSRAILQSGNAVVPLMMAGKQVQTNATIDVIKGSLCPLPSRPSENTTQELDKKSILCLKQTNASLLYRLYKKVFSERIGSFLPIEENDFFGEHPFEMVKKRQFYSNKEILIGTNSFEGAHFSALGPLKKFWFSDKIDTNFTKDNIIEILNQTLPKQYKSFIKIIIDYALDGVMNDKDPVEVWQRYVKIVGDIIFVCSDFVFIKEYSASNRSVFYYRFKPKATYLSGAPKWAFGAIHSEEIPFVFGIPLLIHKFYTLKEIELSKTIVNMWTLFAKTGTPLCCDSWPQYRTEKPIYMSLDVTENHLNNGFPGYKCDEYYETLISETRNYVRSGQRVPI